MTFEELRTKKRISFGDQSPLHNIEEEEEEEEDEEEEIEESQAVDYFRNLIYDIQILPLSSK